MNRYLVGEWSLIKPIKVPVRVLSVKCLRLPFPLPLLRLRLSAPKGRALSGTLDGVEVEVFNTLQIAFNIVSFCSDVVLTTRDKVNTF